MRKGEDYTGVSIVYLCHYGNSKYLLAKKSINCRYENGIWDCGGGGMGFGDTVENTPRKEIAEEYCTNVVKYKSKI